MVTLNAHFDGKVFIPDEPLVLKPHQKVRISVEPIDPSEPAGAPDKPRTDFSSWRGLAHQSGDRPHDPATDEDGLWNDPSGGPDQIR